MKRITSFLLALVMILGMFPMATFAEDTVTKPVVHLTADKTSVLAGEEITLSLTLDGDVDSEDVAGWEWDFVYDSAYFEITGSTVGNAAESMLPGKPAFAVTPIVNPAPKGDWKVGTYKYASVTQGNNIVPHYLKKGTIATLTLKAKEDITEEISSKFYFVPVIVMNSSGTRLDVVDADATTCWDYADFKERTEPASTVGLPITITKPVEPIDITFYYADKNGIVTGDDDAQTLLNFAPLTVNDLNGDGVFTMEEAFIAAHDTYYQGGTAGFEGSNWVTHFWGIEDSNSSYVHNHKWVYSPQEEIKDGDSVSFFWYQDVDLSNYENAFSDLYTYFDNLTGTATAKEETTFHVNGYSVFGSSSTADAVAAPVGATVTATCEGQDDLTTTVDAEGNFKLTFPAAGTWTILVNGKCNYTATVGYYANKAYTNAPVVPAQMTVTVAEAAYVAPDPVNVSLYFSRGKTVDGVTTTEIVNGKDGTALNYVTLNVSDKDKDGKLTINDAFLVLHENYYTDGVSGYSRADGSYTFWGFTSTSATMNPFIFLNDTFNVNTITVNSEIKKGDKICAFNQTTPQFPYAYFDDGVTGTATAGTEASFHITGNRTDGTHTLSGATVTATCGDTTVIGTNDENGNVVITFPTAGTYTLVVSGKAKVDGKDNSEIPIHSAMMTVTVAEAQVNPDPTPDPDPEPTETGYTVTLDKSKTVNVGETISIDVKVGHTAETVTTYNAFDMTFSYDATALKLTSTEITGLTVTAGEGTVRVQGYGADRAIGSTAFTLTFEALATGETKVDVTSAKVDISANAIVADAPDAVKTVGTTNVTVKGYPVNLPDDFEGASTAEPGKDYTFTAKDKNYNYTFDGTAMGGEDAEVVDNGDGTFTIKNVNGAIVVKSEKTGKTFNVTLGTDMNGETSATHGTDYTATLNKRDGFTYDVSVTMGGQAYTGWSVSDGVYTIPGADITGDIVFTVTRTGVEGYEFTVTVEGTGAGDVTVSANKVAAGGTLTFSVNMSSIYTYDVTITMGGQAASYQKYGSDYTITSVTGDVVITVNKTLNLGGLKVYEYVQMDGKTVFLVDVMLNPGDGKALTYDGTAMFKGRYNAKYGWSYLVIVDNNTTFTAEDAKAKIAVAETSYTTLSQTNTDVNGSGLTDINDAQLVYDIYNGKYDSFDTVTMEKFLYADVNNDKTVNVSDAAAVVAAID